MSSTQNKPGHKIICPCVQYTWWNVWNKTQVLKTDASTLTLCEILSLLMLTSPPVLFSSSSIILLYYIYILSNFNILKTLTLLVYAELWVYAELLWCFYNPLNSDMDYRIFNIYRDIYIYLSIYHGPFCMPIQMGTLVYSLIQRLLVKLVPKLFLL